MQFNLFPLVECSPDDKHMQLSRFIHVYLPYRLYISVTWLYQTTYFTMMAYIGLINNLQCMYMYLVYAR